MKGNVFGTPRPLSHKTLLRCDCDVMATRWL